MAPVPYAGITAGGHTFNMSYEYHGDVEENLFGCNTDGCHSSVEEFDHNGFQTDIMALLDQLEATFDANGWLDEEGLWDIARGDSLVVSANEAGAMLNWKTVKEDRSYGIHNPTYMKAILQNSIESLQ
jgi:hypothetical protein